MARDARKAGGRQAGARMSCWCRRMIMLFAKQVGFALQAQQTPYTSRCKGEHRRPTAAVLSGKERVGVPRYAPWARLVPTRLASLATLPFWGRDTASVFRFSAMLAATICAGL